MAEANHSGLTDPEDNGANDNQLETRSNSSTIWTHFSGESFKTNVANIQTKSSDTVLDELVIPTLENAVHSNQCTSALKDLSDWFNVTNKQLTDKISKLFGDSETVQYYMSQRDRVLKFFEHAKRKLQERASHFAALELASMDLNTPTEDEIDQRIKEAERKRKEKLVNESQKNQQNPEKPIQTAEELQRRRMDLFERVEDINATIHAIKLLESQTQNKTPDKQRLPNPSDQELQKQYEKLNSTLALAKEIVNSRTPADDNKESTTKTWDKSGDILDNQQISPFKLFSIDGTETEREMLEKRLEEMTAAEKEKADAHHRAQSKLLYKDRTYVNTKYHLKENADKTNDLFGTAKQPGDSTKDLKTPPIPAGQNTSSAAERALEMMAQLVDKLPNFSSTNSANPSTSRTSPREHIPKLTIEKFNGDIELAANWFDTYATSTKSMKWSDECRAENFKSYLTGDALSWYSGVFGINTTTGSRSEPPNWTRIAEEYEKEYFGPTSRSHFQQQYLNFEPKSDETWAQCVRRFRDVASKANTLNPKDNLRHLGTRLGKWSPLTGFQFAHAASYAEAIEIAQLMDSTDPNKPHDLVQESTAELTKPSRPKDRRNDNNNNNTSQPWRTPRPQESNQIKIATNDQKNKENKPVVSYNPADKIITCMNCEQMGHRARDCRERPKDSTRILGNYNKWRNKLNIKDRESAAAVSMIPTDDDVDWLETTIAELTQEPELTASTHVLGKEARLALDKPVLTILVGGVPARAMLDSGSYYSLASGIFAHYLGKIPFDDWTGRRLVSVNNREVTPKKQISAIKVEIEQLDLAMDVRLGVIKDQAFDIILGTDFLKKAKLVMDFDSNTVFVKSQLKGALSHPQSEQSDDKKADADVEQFATVNSVLEYTPGTEEEFQEVTGKWNFESPKRTFSDSQSKPKRAHALVQRTTYFDPNQIRLVPVRLTRPISQLSVCTIADRAQQFDWEIEECVIPSDTNKFHVLVRNRRMNRRALLARQSVAIIELIDNDTADQLIDFNPQPVECDIVNAVEERNKRQDNAVQELNARIWKPILEYPSPDDKFLNNYEKTLDSNDNYFENNIDIEFLSKFDISKDIDNKSRLLLQRFFKHYTEVYAFKGDQLGRVDCHKHRIPTPGQQPIKQNPYRVSEKQKLEIEKQVNDMIHQGVIVPAISSWSSPVTLVPKRDGTWRFCIDYRRLNDITSKDSFPIPRLDEALSVMGGCDRFSIQDAQSCFWQIPLHSKDQEKTTFVCHLGTFMFKVMPFGLTGAPASCMRAMGKIFRDLERRIGFIYMDDLICFSKGMDEHIRRLCILADRCKQHGLKMRADKCSFAYPSVAYLGHIITESGTQPDMNRHRAILEKPAPKDIKTLQQFLGFVNFYRHYIQNMATIAEPLTRLLRKGVQFVWEKEQVDAHRDLITKLTSAPILAHYDPTADIEMRTDASDEGIGVHLVQVKNGNKQLLACHSRTLSTAELNYHVTEKECLAIMEGTRKFRPYLYGREFRVVTDHCALCYLLKARDLVKRLTRWSLELSDYTFTIVYNSGKVHGDADYLSRNLSATSACDSMHPNIPTEELDHEMQVCVLRCHMEMDDQVFDLEPQDVTNEQKKDPELNRIIEILNGELVVNNKEKKRTDWNYVIENGLLKQKMKFDGEPVTRLLIPKSLVRTVLTAGHDLPTAGHFGFRRTFLRLARYVYWKGFAKDIQGYVQSCHQCQLRRMPTTRPHGFTTGVEPVATRVFEVVSMDVLGPLNTSEDGNTHILTITDMLSKFVIAAPLPDTKEATVMEQLERYLFYTFGPPVTLITDQGTNMCGQLSKDTYKVWGVTHVTTSAFHCQSNGQAEVMNKVLAIQLTAQCNNKRDKWDRYLLAATLAYNTSVHSTVGYSPYYLVFGREPDESFARKLGTDGSSIVSGSLEAARKVASERIKAGQKQRQDKTNSKRNECQLKVDEVLFLSKPLKMQSGSKLSHRWLGPYRIINAYKNNLFKIETKLAVKKKIRVVNWLAIKRYHNRAKFRLQSENGEVVCTCASAPREPDPQVQDSETLADDDIQHFCGYLQLVN